jgi:hypothetical protein
MHAYKLRTDESYIPATTRSGTKRSAASATVRALHDGDVATGGPSPVHAMQANLAARLANETAAAPLSNLAGSRLLVIGTLAVAAWAPFAALGWALLG